MFNSLYEKPEKRTSKVIEMNDYFKCKTYIKEPERILQNTLLNFIIPLNSATGEVCSIRNGYEKRTAKYKGIVIDYIHNLHTDNKYFEISGSLHKFYHNGSNYSDFTLNELSIAINEICQLLEITPQETKIHRIEFGVNIATQHPVNKLLDSLICCKGKPYELRQFSGKGYLKCFKFEQYHVKVYNKGLQYGLQCELMRFEVKVNRMDYLLKKGVKIECLADLLKPEIHLQLSDLLRKTIESLLMFDYRIKLKAIHNQRERFILTEGINPMFWNEYKKNHSNKAYYKKINRFKELVLKYSNCNLHSEILDSILTKWDSLISTPLLPNVIGPKVPHYYTHIVGNNNPILKRYCITCGRDITHQRKGSSYCSEKLFGSEVKKCRNKVSNRKRFELKHYSGLLLFDISQVQNTNVRG